MKIGDRNADVGGDLRNNTGNLNIMWSLMEMRGLAGFAISIHLEIRGILFPHRNYTRKCGYRLMVLPVIRSITFDAR
jgi:hypothetical protein